MFKNRELSIERISDIVHRDLGSAVARLKQLDCCYAGDETVKPMQEGGFEYLLSPDGLAGDGIILKNGSEDIGYALLYKVENERRTDLHPFFREARERSDWDSHREYIGCILGEENSLAESRLWHFFDYAVVNDKYRSRALGRLLMRRALDMALPEGDVAVGFIDPGGRADSIIAAAKAGCAIGKKVPVSPDGEHSSVLLIHAKGSEILQTGRELSYRKGQMPLSALVDEVCGIVDAENLVVYNRVEGRFEEGNYVSSMPIITASQDFGLQSISQDP